MDLWEKFAGLPKKLQPQGCYSIRRLRRLTIYTQDASSCRLFVVCLLTPLPCVALATLIEAAPLEPPEAGPYANYMFWIRAWLVTGFVDYSMVLQMSQSLNRIKMGSGYIALIALVGSLISFATVFGVAVTIAFPVPFSMLVASPPSVVVILVGFSYMWGRRWRNDAQLRQDLVRHTMVFMCQVALTFTYPLYIFGFSSLSGWRQTAFVVLLPLIKSAGKHWISYMLANQNDIKPEVVIFNMEVFNALYVANAVQNSSSVGTTAALMVIDMVHFWFSMRGTLAVLGEVKILMTKIPPRHPSANESFVVVALRLLAIEDQAQANSRRCSGGKCKQDSLVLKTMIALKHAERRGPSVTLHLASSQAELVSVSGVEKGIFKWFMPRTTKVFAMQPPQLKMVNITTTAKAETYPKLERLFSHQERVEFIIATARVLYITEYVVLVEYAEAVLPMVYALYSVIAFHLPNSVYNRSFTDLSSRQLFANAGYVLAYGMLELMSLILVVAVLNRVLGISSLHQLCFVLETQAKMVQSKLMLWFVYVMQVPLVHVGTDYSFTFKWVSDAKK